MSRLDYFTLAVVAICILAIGFLLYKTSDLLSGKTEKDPKEEVMDALKEMGIEEDTLYTEPAMEEEKAETQPTSDNEPMTTPAKTNTSEEVDYAEKTPSTSKSPSKKSETTAAPAPATKAPEKVTPPASKPSAASTAPSGGFLVVAGSFKLRHNAENEAKRLQKLGYPNAKVEIFNKGALATLVVDRFASEKEATAVVSALKDKGIPSYVQRKRGGE